MTVDESIIPIARAAQKEWARTSVRERIRIVRRFRDEVFNERQRIALTISTETGKPIPESSVSEVATVLEGARFLERVGERTLRPRRVRPKALALWSKRLVTYHEPYGVVVVISPWNYPFLLTAMHILPSILAGNAVLLKPSEFTPRTADLLRELLKRAGLPEGLLQVVHGDGRVGAALVESPVDKVFFTGSERTGRSIALSCAPRFIPVSLELGGSDAAIVLDDASLDVTVSGILWGRFANAGQTCVAVKRVIAVDSIHDALVSRLASQLEHLAIGDALVAGMDVGRLISPAQRDLVMSQLDDAIAHGATVAARKDPSVELAGGAFAPLVTLTNVTPEMRVWREETFGPVLAIMRASNDEHALELANDSIYGLSGSVWTSNLKRGHALARRMDAGAIAINDAVLTAGIPELPHGGVKSSGMGRVHGIEGLLECVRTRTIVDDVRSPARQGWWFGYGRSGAERVDSYMRLSQGRTLRERLSGVAGTLKLMFRPERPL